MAQLAGRNREDASAIRVDRGSRSGSAAAAANAGGPFADLPPVAWTTPLDLFRQTFETSTRLRGIWLDGMDALMQEQVAYLRGAYDDARRCGEELLAAPDAEARAKLTLDYAREAAERFLANSMAVAELVSRPASEMLEVLARQAFEGTRQAGNSAA